MFYNRWHPEVAIRYLPIVAEIKKHQYQTILEVGSGGLGITPYLKQKVVGLDTKFEPPFHPKLEKKTGTGLKIPFADKSFDVVISVDTLEHISSENREKVILEMIRVAKKEIIIAVPTGEKSSKQDKELNEAYKQIYGKSFYFLDEQIGHGLPDEEEIKKILGDNVKIEKNESLILRDFLMRGWMKTDFFSKLFYWKILLLFILFFKLFNKPPYYRTIFYKKL